MSILFYLIIIVHVLACFFLIAVVLLQQGKGQDLASAFGGGGTQTAFGPRGSATVLSRATTILAGVFVVTSLGLTIVRPRSSGILDQVPATAATPAPKTSALPIPVAPATSAPAPVAPAASAPTTRGPAEAPKPAPTPGPEK